MPKQLNQRMNFQIDISQARQQLKLLQAQMDALTDTSGFSRNFQNGLTSEIVSATKAATLLKTQLTQAVNPLTGNLNLTKFSDQLMTSQMSLKDYKNQLTALGTAGNQAFNSLARSIATAETPLLRTSQAAQTMWTALGNTARWQATSSLMHGIMSTAASAMSYVKNLDSSLNSIRIVTGQTQDQMARFAVQANQAAKELNTSTNAYARASLIYYQQGLSNEQVKERTEATIKLANVSGQSAAKVSDQMTAIWNNFYDGSKSLEYYADVITALGATTASSSEEIAKGLSKFSSIAQTTGLSYEYATSALSTVVAATRQSADSVGTTFKTLFSRLQGLNLGETLDDGVTLNKYSKALDTIGINILNANGQMKDMDSILDEMGAKWQNLSKAQQAALAQTIGGVRSYTGLMSLMDNWDSFQKNLQTAQEAQGTLQTQADIYAQSWEAASAHVRAASETIYKNLLNDDFFKGLTHGLGTVLDGIGAITNGLGGFKGTMAAIGNTAFQVFGNQIAKSSANIGLNIRGIVKGQQDVIDIKSQAREALRDGIPFSNYDRVNQLSDFYNQQMDKRSLQYEQMVKKGKVPEYLKPVYQSMFANTNAMTDAALRSAEQMYENQGASTVFQRDQARSINNMVQQEAQKLTSQGLITDPIKKAQADAATQYSLDLGTVNKLYKAQYQTTEAGILQSMLNPENPGTVNLNQAKNLAGYIMKMDEGFNRMGTTMEKSMPALQNYRDEITKLQTDLEKKAITQEEYNTKLTNLFNNFQGKDFNQVMEEVISKPLESAGAIKNQMVNELSESLGVSTQEAEKTLSKLFTDAGMSAAEKASVYQKVGGASLVGTALGKQLNIQDGEKRTIAFSNALSNTLGLMSAGAQTVNSLGQAMQVFTKQGATATEYMSSIASVGMSMGMLIKPVQNFKEHFEDTMTLFGKDVSVFGKPLTQGAFGFAALGATAALALGTALYKDLAKNNVEGIQKAFDAQTATATQLASGSQQSYEQLVTNRETQSNLLNQLYSTATGTTDFTQTLVKNNTLAQKMIEDYNLEYGKDYTYGRYGETIFNQEQLDQAVEKASQEALERQVGSQQLNAASKLFDLSQQSNGETLLSSFTDTIIEGKKGYQTDPYSLAQAFAEYKNLNIANPEIMSAQEWLQNQEFLDLDSTKRAFGVTTDEELAQKFDNIATILSDETIENVNARVNEAFSGSSQNLQMQNAIARGIVDYYAATSLDKSFINNDLAANIMNDSITANQVTQLTEFIGKASQKTFLEGVSGKTPNDWYQALFGTTPSNKLTSDEISTLVSEKILEMGILDTDKLVGIAQGFGFSAKDLGLEGITGLNTIAEQIQQLNLPDLASLTKEQTDAYFKDRLATNKLNQDLMSHYGANVDQLEKFVNEQKGLTKAQETYNKMFENLEKQLTEQVLINYNDGLLDGSVNGLSDQVSLLTSDLTYGSMKELSEGLSQASLLGHETVMALQQLSIQDRDLGNNQFANSFSSEFKDILRDFSFENSLNGVYSNSQLMRFAKNQETRDKYTSLLAAQIKDMGEEKGLFEKLYSSSGFDKIMDKLTQQFELTGNISAQIVDKLAEKQENLNQLISVGSKGIEGANINSAGLASTFEEVAKGTISLDNVSSDLISALSTAKQTEAYNSEAFSVVDNLDLGRSGEEYLSYFRDMGKAFFAINKSDWGFNNDQIKSMVNLIGNQQIKDAFYEINRSGNTGDFTKLMDQMPSYFTDFLKEMAGPKGKGNGGGPEDVTSYMYNLLGGSSISEEDWDRLGFKMDAAGNFWLGKGMTSDNLINNLTQELIKNGMGEEEAANLAKVYAGQVATSGGTGADMEDAAATLAFKEYMNGLKLNEDRALEARLAGDEEGKNKGQLDLSRKDLYDQVNGLRLATEEEINTFVNQNREFLTHNLETLTGQNWSSLQQYGVSLENFMKDYFTSQGGIVYDNKQNRFADGMKLESFLDTFGKNVGDFTENTKNFQEIATAFGAYSATSGTYDYNKLVEMVEAVGGTEANLVSLISQYPNLFNGILYARGDNGEEISFDSSKGVSSFLGQVHSSQTARSIINTTVENLRSMYGDAATTAGMYWKNDEGEWELDIDGSKRAQRALDQELGDLYKQKADLENLYKDKKIDAGTYNAELESVKRQIDQKIASGANSTKAYGYAGLEPPDTGNVSQPDSSTSGSSDTHGEIDANGVTDRGYISGTDDDHMFGFYNGQLVRMDQNGNWVYESDYKAEKAKAAANQSDADTEYKADLARIKAAEEAAAREAEEATTRAAKEAANAESDLGFDEAGAGLTPELIAAREAKKAEEAAAKEEEIRRAKIEGRTQTDIYLQEQAEKKAAEKAKAAEEAKKAEEKAAADAARQAEKDAGETLKNEFGINGFDRFFDGKTNIERLVEEQRYRDIENGQAFGAALTSQGKDMTSYMNPDGTLNYDKMLSDLYGENAIDEYNKFKESNPTKTYSDFIKEQEKKAEDERKAAEEAEAARQAESDARAAENAEGTEDIQKYAELTGQDIPSAVQDLEHQGISAEEGIAQIEGKTGTTTVTGNKFSATNNTQVTEEKQLTEEEVHQAEEDTAKAAELEEEAASAPPVTDMDGALMPGTPAYDLAALKASMSPSQFEAFMKAQENQASTTTEETEISPSETSNITLTEDQAQIDDIVEKMIDSGVSDDAIIDFIQGNMTADEANSLIAAIQEDTTATQENTTSNETNTESNTANTEANVANTEANAANTEVTSVATENASELTDNGEQKGTSFNKQGTQYYGAVNPDTSKPGPDDEPKVETPAFDPATNQIKNIVEDIADNVSTQTDLAKDASKETTGANGTAKNKNVTTDEEGNLVDENGNPIEMPYEQPASTSTSGYTGDYSGNSSDGSGSGGGGRGSGGGGGGSGGSSPAFGGDTVAKSISNFFNNNIVPAGDQYKIGDNTYTYLKDEDGGVVGFTDDQTGISYDMEGTPIGGQAVGQNNAHILQFAQGHMAVTGELGPELTIREDGTVDMLGQHGREYTWVNPNDIIYTAAQTTSILGNNNIEWLDGFAKGFNNKIKGHFDGGTAADWNAKAGPSSGIGEAVRRGAYSGTYGGAMAAAEETETDPRYDPNTLKERDIVTRYFTILQQIDDITREVEHFGKVAERAWGEERVQAIQRQTDAYKEQYAAYQKYMAEIETYLRSDQDALTLMVEEFARDFKEKTSIDIFGGKASSGSGGTAMRTTNAVYGGWASGYNNNIKPHSDGYFIDSLKSEIAAGSGSSSSEELDPNLRNPINWVSAEYDANGVLTNYREIVTRLMEVYNENAEAFAQDKEAQYKFQEMLKDIQFYTDSLNLYEQQKEVMYDLRNAILDNQIRKIVYEISYENELDNNALKEINYNFEKIRDNAYRSAEAIDYYATRMDYLDKSNERYKEGIKDILATYSGNVTNGIQRQIMMRLYRKAPMEGYTSVDSDSNSTEILRDSVGGEGSISWSKVTAFNEIGPSSVYSLGGSSNNEKTTKLAVDHVDENGLIHLNDGSIVDPVKKKRYKGESKSTGAAASISAGNSDWGGLLNFDYIKQIGKVEAYASSSSNDEGEKEELPYFPTSVEIEDYFKNFKAVKIGEETYYVPNDTNVDIREDMVQPVDITRAIVDNKGRLSQDEKDLITTQVKSWYDELANMAPELAKDIKPIYEDGFMVNFREVMNAINEANAHMSDYMYDLLLNDTEEFFEIWSKVTVENADFQDLTTETATQLENMIDTIYANLQQKEKYIETVIATLGNDIKTFNKDLNTQVDEFEYFNEVMNDYQNIIDLTNRRSTNIGSDLIAAISDAQLGNAMNKVSGTKTVRDTMAQMKAQAQETYDLTKNAFETYRDELLKTMTAEEVAQDAHYLYLQNRLDQVQDEMDIANAKFEDSNKQFLKAWEDALSKIEQNYTKAVEEASRTFEESFSPYFNTLELLQAQFERQKALEDYYVDDFQRIHDLAALDRSIEQSILDTDNLKSKGRLRDLQKEINDLQEDGTELSAYDLDILQKKYDLELARQALEDAKDAKSLVRLARDNNGNWSYVYTSNETEVDEAEQNYENAIRSMEEANQNYIDNLEAQILQVQQSALAAMQGLDITDFANPDEFYAALKNIEDGANETTRYLSEQLGHAFDNNEYLDPFIKDRYNGQNLHNLTTDWNDMTLAAVSGINTLDDATGSIDNRLGALRDKLMEEFIKYSEEQAKVYELAGADIADANGYFSKGINEVMAMSDENVEKTTELADRVGDAFEKTAAKVRDFNKDIFDLTTEYEKLNSVMIKFLEISGEYVPEEKLDFSTTIDTYKELDEIKQVLGKYGKLIVTDYDEQGNRRIYNLEENTEATAKQFDAWYDAIAKADAIDVGKDLDSQEEYDKINAYLEKHGQVYISIDGELKKLSKDNEEDMAWLQNKLTAIQEAAKQMEQSIAYFGDYVSDGPGRDTAFYGTVEHEEGSPTITVHFPGGGGYVTENGVWDHALDTGGYTGRWQYADTGMYTGEWDGGSERKNGRLAWLHQKELVLNAHDTENFLDAMNIVRQLDNLASWMANGLGDLFMPRVEGNDETLEQNVHIEASFPNAVDHNEIEQAFGNLVNLASQYANRKAFA